MQRPSVLQLRVLGVLDLSSDDPTAAQAVLAQPKRTALLAYLSVREPGAYCRRDALLALFWPEADTERARTALRGALHFLRRSLGADVIRTRGDDVGIDSELLECDAAQFIRAIGDGRLDDALTLYRGDLLDGVYVAGADEFERWRDDERMRLRRMAIDAAIALGKRREAEGDVAGAVKVARQGMALAPDDEVLAQRLISTLDKSGDRAGALRAYDELAARLRADYESEPSPETRALLNVIRGRELARGMPVESPPVVASVPPVSPVKHERTRRRAIALFAAVAVATLGIAAALYARTGANAVASSPDVVVVLPFTYEGSTRLEYLGDGLSRLLTTNLNGVGALRTVDPIAVQRAIARKDGKAATIDVAEARAIGTRFGSGLVVRGRVVESGGRVRVTMDVIGGSARLTQIDVDGTSDRLFDLVDELTAQLVADWGNARGKRLTSLAAQTTHSLPALRAYVDGEREYSAGRYVAAVDAYQRAVAADSTFALAYYRLSSALAWTSNPFTLAAATRARHFVGRLSRRDSLLVEARFANSSGVPQTAEQLYRQVLADYPDEIEAWYQLGEVQFHWGAMLGHSAQRSEPAFVRAIALDPTHVPALVHLARLAAGSGRTARVDSLRVRVASIAAGTEEAREGDALYALARNTPADVTALRARLLSADGAQLLRILPPLAAATENVSAIAPIVHAIGKQGDAQGARALLFAAELEMARGRWRAANTALDRVAESSPANAAQYRAVFVAASLAAVDSVAIAALRAELLRAPLAAANNAGAADLLSPVDDPGGLLVWKRAYLLARLSAKTGDTVGTKRALATAVVRNAADSLGFAALQRRVRADVAWRAGRADEALRMLGPASLPLDDAFPRMPSFATADERWLRAELLRATGRDEEALAWYATFPDPSGYDLIYLAPAHLAQANILAKLGRRDAAREHYRRFIVLWSDCDRELASFVEDARRRITALD